jgi:hypothetical protein
MIISIRYRVDSSEFYETDENKLATDNWETVFNEIRSIETRNTVLEVKRLDID